ncbi:MAG: PAS domain-containing protein [Pseudomonadota bacterium]
MPLSPANHRRARQLAVLVAAAYAVFGSLWILLSDAAVRMVSTDPGWLELAQRGKGLAFVALTATALLAMVQLGSRRLLLAVQQGAHSALRVQDLFEQHPQPMWYYAPGSLAFLRVNEAAVRLYGHSQAEFLAMTVPALRCPGEQAALAQQLRSRAPGVVGAGRARHRCKSGAWLDVQISAQAASYDGQPAVLVLAVDISAQVAAQQAQQRQEQLFRELHQSLAEVLWMASADGQQVLYVSPAFESVYGLPASAFQRDPSLWLAHVHPDDQAVALASGQDLMQRGSVACQYRICRPDGQVRWVSDRKKLVVDTQGGVSMIAGIAEDITERRLDQDTLRRNAAELADRYAELARFNQAAVDREIDMIALKREVNALAAARALPARYQVDFAVTAPGMLGVG